MKLRSRRFIPAAIMSAVAAVPILTAGEILTHMGRTVEESPPIPRRSGGGAHHHQSRGSGTATPTSTPTTKPKARPSPTPSPAGVSGTFTGGTYPDLFGTLSASITVRSGRIVSVSTSAPMDNPRSAYINEQAVPILKTETLQAQSSQISGVSGATATSDAFYQSLVDALGKAGL